MSDSATAQASAAWPVLSYPEWKYTYHTLHLWTQIVGKVRLASTAPRNHWWHVPLYVDVRGLTTRRLRAASGLAFEIKDRLRHVDAVNVPCVPIKTDLRQPLATVQPLAVILGGRRSQPAAVATHHFVHDQHPRTRVVLSDDVLCES